MKKTTLCQIALAIALVGTFAGISEAAQCQGNPRPNPPMNDRMGPPPMRANLTPEQKAKMKKEHAKQKAKFDSRLNLTAEQKAKIEQNRIESQKKIKPLIDQMKAKREAIHKIQESNMSLAEKDKKIAPLKEDIKNLRKEAHQYREENRKAFESVLTDKQKKELAKMKKEHENKMQKNMKNHKPPMSHTPYDK
ncbi:MAG: Spy/CpxP family protein refolding chaperone [Candidatus Gastranaerophilales bacterium]|nr:Spy/CpxP family protein refolding chaperone [Candidatus Gastranaerophilales bacterium]